jgi:hypothetical protein
MYQHLERERVHLLLLNDVLRGLTDILAGRTEEADAAIARMQKERKAAESTRERRGLKRTPAPD